MIEQVMIDYLENELDGVPVFAEVPEEHYEKMVIVDKTGSSLSNRVYSVTVAVQSYAESLLQAAALNEIVKSAVLRMTALDVISSVRLNSDYNYTDTQSKRYRYQAVFVITYLEV